ncbi:MAG: kinase/pyrophosphorylase [Collinsella sp.]
MLSELEEARALMKRLGCFVVRTDGKAIEESAAEIISHLGEIQKPVPAEAPAAPNNSSTLIKRFSSISCI